MQKQTTVNADNKFGLLTIASHDLKQTVNAVTLSVDALEIEASDDKQKKIIKTLKDSVNAMERMLNALLNISKLEAGIIQPNKKPFKLEELLCYLRPEYQGLSQQRNLNFQCAETEWVTHTDPILLETIIRNLVANAFRYTSTGKIWINCKKNDNGAIAIEVGDTGIGINENLQEKIFSPNYQVDTPKGEASEGFGLGLAIVQNLAKILDLGITMDSKIDFGSRFVVTVPEGHLIAMQT